MRSVLVVVLLVACGTSKPGGLDPALEAKGVDGLRKLAEVYASNASDCDMLGHELERWSAAYTPVFQAIADAARSGQPPWTGNHAAELAELRAKARPALARCASNPAVIEASQRLRLE